jgi:hypothetical protein
MLISVATIGRSVPRDQKGSRLRWWMLLPVEQAAAVCLACLAAPGVWAVYLLSQPYDRLLARGVERFDARAEVAPLVDTWLTPWTSAAKSAPTASIARKREDP